MGNHLELLKTLGSAFKKFLPPSVSIQAWADHRIPRDDLEEVNAGGLIYVPLDDAKSTTARRIAKSPPGPPPGLDMESRKRRRVGNGTSNFEFDAFLALLPEGELTPEEECLRQTVIHYLHRRRCEHRLSKLPALHCGGADRCAESGDTAAARESFRSVGFFAQSKSS